MLHEYLVLAGGAADIPMSRLIGQTGGRGMDGGGMSSGGNGGANVDLRNYYDRIAAKQKTVYSPAMALLDECVVRHALGKYDDSIVYDWSPLWQLDESGKAALAAAKANVAKTDIEMGLINEDVLREGRVQQLLDDNFYPGFQDALDKFGAEPPEPDIQVAWSRLAGAMAQSTQEAMPKQLAGPGGASPQDKPPAAAPPEPADPMPGLMKRLGVEPKVPNIRVTQNQDAEPVDVNDRMVTKAEANYRQTGGLERCGNCSMFEAPDRCTLVEGMILPEDVCDYWEQD
jgi:hypothetical protein